MRREVRQLATNGDGPEDVSHMGLQEVREGRYGDGLSHPIQLTR